ncbi:uncharacterized protein L201_000489 [Kwoniella dendrophila CBS 6074]|uniref:intramembrane prenyl-peptidase Rce1 n=1 Tax=Kwoniella dendrophila CBS 6074 TaxID=1295534 RepID=A0AAX4JL85_9TREE
MDSSLALPPNLVGIITPSTAHTLSFLATTSYVGSLYLSQKLFNPKTPKQAKAKPINSNHDDGSAIPPISSTDDGDIGYEGNGPKPGSRDHPETMKRRMIAVIISTTLSLSSVYLTIKSLAKYSGNRSSIIQSLTLLGLRLPNNNDNSKLLYQILPWTLAPILMTGPLFAMLLDDDLPLIGNRYHGEGLLQKLGRGYREFGLMELRNYAVGPITEELVFRSSILSVSILGGLSFSSMVFGTPLWFGIAHAHHALETFRKNGSTKHAAIHAILGCLFQLSYTTLFGWFASYLYLRTGSVLPPLTSHIFCNVMGIYLPSTAIARQPKRRYLIWGSYLAGIAGFVWGLTRL